MTDVRTRHIKQLAVMRGWLEGRGYFLAADALEFVRQLEQGTRKDGETPKFHHQLSIARLITTLAPHLANPEHAIAAAFLHDVLEDHGATISREDLAERFGKELADIVWRLSKKSNGLTKDYKLYFTELAECPVASIVKVADRSHNLQTMQGVFSVEKQKAYIGEVEEWFYPLIKTARRRFPRQYPAYENLKILLRCQCRLVEHIHEAGGC
jgi:(p)ppGpp synthase/HD superfamily hydrolase